MRGELAVYASMALVAGPIMFLRAFRDLRIKRLIQDTPTARIRSMAMGRVEVCGTVLGRSAVRAPFSDRPCAYWQVEIAVRSRREGWSTVHRNASGNPFYVQDDTGTALVYPEGAMCRARITGDEECLGVNLPPVYADYLKTVKPMWKHMWRLSALRFRERVLLEGDPIYVMGEAQPRAQAVDLSELEGHYATGTDGPARLHGRRLKSLHQEVSAVIRRGRYDGTFIISQQSESSICFELGISAFLKLIGGPALILFGLGYWLMALASLSRGGAIY